MGNKSSKGNSQEIENENESALRLQKEKEENARKQKEDEDARQAKDAAVKIQSTFRGKVAKKEVEKIKMEVNEKKTKFSQWFTRSMSVMSLLHVIVAFVKPDRSDLLNPSTINIVVIVGLLINWFVFFIHGSGNFNKSKNPTETLYDLTGSLTFFILSMYTYTVGNKRKTLRQSGLTVCIVLWCVRLGTFLYSRMLRDGKDSRFDNVKKDKWRFAFYWTLQGLWNVVVGLPVYVSNIYVDAGGAALNTIDYVGFTLYVVGFLVEIVSDYQKIAFRSISSNKDKYICTGMWSLSRHPNYFGEILLWIGVFVVSSNTYSSPGQYMCVLSPMLTAFLLVFVSGIPLLENHANAKFGKLEEYKKYKEATPVLIPLIGRTGDAKF